MLKEYKKETFDLVDEFKDAFVGPGEPLHVDRTDLIGYKIDTGESESFKLPPRRIPIMQ
jgi:hypothetical protein